MSEPEPKSAPNDAARPKWRLLRAALPWLVAAAIVTLLLARIDARDVARRLASVNAPLYLTTITGFVLMALALDALAGVRLFRAIGADADFRSLVSVRGASYLLGLVNYHAGQAHMTVLLTRLYRLPLMRVAGGTLMTYVTILGALVMLSLPSLVLAHDAVVVRTVAMTAGVGALYLAVIAFGPKLMRRFAATAPLVELGAVGQLRLILWRLPHVASLLLEVWVAYRFFGVVVPLENAVTDLVFILLVSGLPITPMGVGTRDVVAVGLLSRFAIDADAPGREASVLAAGAALVTARVVAQLLIGLLFFRRGVRILEAGRD